MTENWYKLYTSEYYDYIYLNTAGLNVGDIAKIFLSYAEKEDSALEKIMSMFIN